MLRLLDLRGRSGSTLTEGLPRPAAASQLPYDAVRSILAAVRERGDAALRELTERFDGVTLAALRVDPGEIAAAEERVPGELLEALRAAAAAVRDYHERTVAPAPPYERDGIHVSELRRGVDRAGCYVPGGRARYPSSVLMTAIPAQVAGVGSVALCVPPGPGGVVDPATLAAASVVGVDEVYPVGGAQAIAAMAYGTETVRAVDVIAGPGNLYVSLAQREVAGIVGVPSAFAGPSEVVVIADDTVDAWAAAVDVVVQAEHGPAGLAWLVTWSAEVGAAVQREVAEIVAASPRREEIAATLESGGYVALVDGPAAALELANAIAPEHLELCCANAAGLLPLVRRAGAVFVGEHAPASVGDYLAGPSHVLPTSGAARFSSALGVQDFQTRVHAIELDLTALRRVAPHVAAIADAEGLAAHALSVRGRVDARDGARS
jgi:histidinol dehydrogenase